MFFLLAYAERLACCRAAVHWVCGLAVRRHGQQAGVVGFILMKPVTNI